MEAAAAALFLEKEAMRVLPWLGAVAIAMATGALAHDQFGNPNWINIGRYVSPIDGSLCCGEHDCFMIPPNEVHESNGGYLLLRLNETVPPREVQISRDGNYWRCKKPDGSRRCFFAPPPAI